MREWSRSGAANSFELSEGSDCHWTIGRENNLEKNQAENQVAFKSQKLDHMVSVEKKTAPTMNPPKITQISMRIRHSGC